MTMADRTGTPATTSHTVAGVFDAVFALRNTLLVEDNGVLCCVPPVANVA